MEMRMAMVTRFLSGREAFFDRVGDAVGFFYFQKA